MSNKCRCNDCSPKRGDRGLTGPAGPQGPQGVQGLPGVGSSVLFNQMPLQLDVTQPYGYPYGSGTPYYITAGSVEEVTPLTLTVVEAGNYIVNAEVIFDAGQEVPSKWIGYEVRKNGVVVPFSTRVVRITGGTPSDVIGSYSVNAKVLALVPGDKISFWVANINDVPPVTSFSIIIAGGSMTARTF